MPSPQPPVVRAATTVILASAIWAVVQAVATLQNVGSTETVDALNRALKLWGNPGHISITTLQTALTVAANVAAVLAAAVGVLAISAGKGTRQARTGLAVLAVPALLASLMANAYAGIPMLIGICLLWTRGARAWFQSPEPAGSAPSPFAPVAPAAAPAAPAPIPAPQTLAMTALPPGAPIPPAPAGVLIRPQRVTISAVVAIVLSALAAGAGLLGGVGLAMLHTRPDLRQSVVDQAHDDHVSLSLSDLDRYLTAMTVGAAVVALLGLLGVLAAVLVLRGSRRARVALIVLSALCAVLSLVSITSVISVVWLVGSLSVVFGLRARDSAAWFTQR